MVSAVRRLTAWFLAGCGVIAAGSIAVVEVEMWRLRRSCRSQLAGSLR